MGYKSALVGVLLLSLAYQGLFGRYRVEEIEVRPAEEYADHIDFQNVVIGAMPCTEEECARKLFDTDRFGERGIVPILLVVENRNDFGLRIDGSEAFLVLPDGSRRPPLDVAEVLIRLTTGRASGDIPTRPEVAVGQIRNRNMVEDFRNKAFGEKWIAPNSTEYGVLFYDWDLGGLDGIRLYFPNVWNVTDDEPLIFFELELGRTHQ